MALKQPVPAWMRPLWVRGLLVALPGVWAVAETVYGESIWAMMFGFAAAWGFWTLIVKFEEQPPPPDDTGPSGA